MIEDNILKVVRKFLIGNVFDVNGFKYKFLKVEPYEHGSKSEFKFDVNVELPNENQSYVVAKFDGDIQNILINLWKYFGVSFSYSIHKIFVNGEKKDEKDIYVSPDKLKEIVSLINKEINKVYVISREMGKIELDVSFKIDEYYLSDVNMTFNFDIQVSNLRNGEKLLQPNTERIDDLASALQEDLNDNDSFRNDAEDVIYNVLEPEFQVRNMDDLYYNVNFYITKVDGIYVSSHWTGDYISKDFFI